MWSTTTIPGLTYHDAYLDPEEQDELLATVCASPWRTVLERRVQHYGYRYDYMKRTIDRSMRLGPLPEWAEKLANTLLREGLVPQVFDQLIVNEYEPGQGIASHVLREHSGVSDPGVWLCPEHESRGH